MILLNVRYKRTDLFFYIVIYLFLQFLYINTVPGVMMDEPWYANTAYNFSKGMGFTNTNVGHSGGDLYIVYTFLMGIAYFIFDCSLLTGRMVSILGGAVGLIGLYYLLNLLKIRRYIQAIILLMYIFSNIFYVIFRSIRPEGMIMTFGIWAVYFAIRYYYDQKFKTLALSSVLATLAFLCHPNGVLFIADCLIVIAVSPISTGKWRKITTFVIISVLLSVAVFGIALLNPHFDLHYLIHESKTRNSLSNNMNIISNMHNFFQIYTLGIKRLYILLFEIAILITGLFYIKKQSVIQLFVIMGLFNLIFSFLVLTPYPTRSFGEIIIFSLIVSALVLEHLSVRKLNKVMFSLCIIYLLNNFVGTAYLIYSKHKDESYTEISRKVKKHVPENLPVISTLSLWFPFKDQQFFCESTYWPATPYRNLEEAKKKNQTTYIVIPSSFIDGKTTTSGRKQRVLPHYINFYLNAEQLAKSQGELITRVETSSYGIISIWKIKH